MAAQPDEAPVRAISVEDKAGKKRAKKERQRSARAQAAASEAPNPAAGSSAGPAAQQLPSSAHRSSPASPELLDAQQTPSSLAQTAVRLLPEPAEALHQPASGKSRRRGKGKGKLDRSGALPTGGVPASNGAAASPGHHTPIVQAADEHVSALSSPAQRPDSSPYALRDASSAQRLQSPTYEATSAAHQHQDGGSSMPSSSEHTAQGSQAISPAPAEPEEETWQEVRPGRRKLATKPTAAKAGKNCSRGQTLPVARPRPTAAAPVTQQQIGAPQQDLEHEALLQELLLQPKVSRTTTE